MRLRGRHNVRKRYIAHIAALNLGLVMRTLFGHGTPRQAAHAVLVVLVAALRLALQRIMGSAESFFGTLLPRAFVHRRAADLAA